MFIYFNLLFNYLSFIYLFLLSFSSVSVCGVIGNNERPGWSPTVLVIRFQASFCSINVPEFQGGGSFNK